MTAQLQATDSGYSLSGWLDNQHAHIVYQSLPAASSDAIVLNLNDLERVDSAGLALLVLWSNRQKAADGSLHLSNVPLQTRQMIDILGLGEIL